MKPGLLMVLASAVFFLAPNTAGAQGSQQGDTAPGRVLMHNANESAQDITDMSFGETGQATMPAAQAGQSVAYGGVAAGTTGAGGRQERPCSSGPQCRIYFGQ